jgi:hypothetical protein
VWQVKGGSAAELANQPLLTNYLHFLPDQAASQLAFSLLSLPSICFKISKI